MLINSYVGMDKSNIDSSSLVLKCYKCFFQVIIVADYMSKFSNSSPPSHQPHLTKKKTSLLIIISFYFCFSCFILLVPVSILLSNRTFYIPDEQRTIRSMVITIGGDCPGIVILNVHDRGDCHKEGLHPLPDEAVTREGTWA